MKNKTIYAVMKMSFSPPEVESLWSNSDLAFDHRNDLPNSEHLWNPHNPPRVFAIKLDTGKFNLTEVEE